MPAPPGWKKTPVPFFRPNFVRRQLDQRPAGHGVVRNEHRDFSLALVNGTGNLSNKRPPSPAPRPDPTVPTNDR